MIRPRLPVFNFKRTLNDLESVQHAIARQNLKLEILERRLKETGDYRFREEMDQVRIKLREYTKELNKLLKEKSK